MKTNTLQSIVVTLATAASLLHAPVQAGNSGYHLDQRWVLGAAGKWDYLDIDPVRNRLFLSRADHVQVLDLSSGKETGEIANTQGVHGIAFAQDLHLGFTSNGRANTITVFELDTLKVRQEISIPGKNPDAILYEKDSHKLFTFNGKSNDVTVIDAISLAVVATIPAAGRPEFAVSNHDGKIFFNVEDKAELQAIDVDSNALVSSWQLKGCEEPTGLAIDIAHDRLFSVCQNRIMVVTDAKTGRAVTRVNIGEHPDAVIYDAETGYLFSSNGDGGRTLSVIRQKDADHYSLLENVKTAPGAKTMAMDVKTKSIYLPAVQQGTFTVMSFSKK